MAEPDTRRRVGFRARLSATVRQGWALMIANALLVLGWALLGWTLPDLLIILWVEALALVVISGLVFSVVTLRDQDHLLLGLGLYAFMAGASTMILWHIKQQIIEAFGPFGDVTGLALVFGGLVVVQEAVTALRARLSATVRQGGTQPSRSDSLEAVGDRIYLDMLPIAAAIGTGAILFQIGVPMSASYFICVGVKVVATVWFCPTFDTLVEDDITPPA